MHRHGGIGLKVDTEAGGRVLFGSEADFELLALCIACLIWANGRGGTFAEKCSYHELKVAYMELHFAAIAPARMGELPALFRFNVSSNFPFLFCYEFYVNTVSAFSWS